MVRIGRGLLCAIVVATIMSFQAGALAQTHQKQIAIQFNMWGAMGGEALNQSIGQETRDKLEEQEQLSDVYLVSLNEVCYWQWLQIQTLLTQALGYVPMAHWSIATNTDRCAAGGGDGHDGTPTGAPESQTNTIFGNVIIGLAPTSGPWPTGASAMYSTGNPPLSSAA